MTTIFTSERLLGIGCPKLSHYEGGGAIFALGTGWPCPASAQGPLEAIGGMALYIHMCEYMYLHTYAYIQPALHLQEWLSNDKGSRGHNASASSSHCAHFPLFSMLLLPLRWRSRECDHLHIQPVWCFYCTLLSWLSVLESLVASHWADEKRRTSFLFLISLLNCCTVKISQDRIVILNIWNKKTPKMLLLLSGWEPQSLHPKKKNTNFAHVVLSWQVYLQWFCVLLCCCHEEAWLWKGSVCC